MDGNRVESGIGLPLKWKETSVPILIAGPCSVESPEQLKRLIPFLESHPGITMYRFGVWKPRSRPNTYEGAGEKALEWLSWFSFTKPVLIEIGDPSHVESALKFGFHHFWLGARTTVNPFLVQKIVDALKGVKGIAVLVKNPITPDLGLWIGAIERCLNGGIEEVAACHRGFTVFRSARFRNLPHWELPLRLKEHFFNIPLICDPSHISGKREYLLEIAQKAIDLGFDGLMVEIHPDPQTALSDRDQQLTPQAFDRFYSQLQFKQISTSEPKYQQQLYRLRTLIDELDEELLHLIARRNAIVKEIGKLKDHYGIQYLQWERWFHILRSRLSIASKLGISLESVYELFHTLHLMAIEEQSQNRKDSVNLAENRKHDDIS
jgi:chorismate mutase